MLDGFTFIGLLLAGLYAVYYGIQALLRFFFQREPRNWVTKNYKRYSGFNLKKVKHVVDNGTVSAEEFSHQEMVAVFGLLLLKTEVPDVLEKAKFLAEQGWQKQFNYDFYEEIATMTRKISVQGYKKNARALIMFGLRLAEFYDEKAWTGKYKEILDALIQEQTDLEWEFTRGLGR